MGHRSHIVRSTVRVGAAGAVVALLATACAGGGTSTTATPAANLTFALPVAPASLDPARLSDYAQTAVDLVTEKLEHPTADGRMTPGIATGVAQPDPTTLVYTIRSGVTFSDGSPLTATDVAWSLTHLADPTVPGTVTVGVLSSFAGATATGPLTVTVTLKRPDPIARIAIAEVGGIQQARFGKAHPKDLGTPGAIPIGSGPYRVAGDTTQALTLTRNPHYRGTKPKPDRITFVAIPTDTTAQLAMRSGSIQAAVVGDPRTADSWRSISGTTVTGYPVLAENYLSLDTSTAPLDDVHVRRAIAYSIDRTGVRAAAYGRYGNLLQGMVAAGRLADVAPSDAAARGLLDGLPHYDLDPTRARAELAQSAYPHGFALTVPYATGQTWQELTVLNLQENMKALGVTITPKAVPLPQLLANAYQHQNLGVLPLQVGSDGADPLALLGFIATRAGMQPHGFNTANWSTPASEAAMAALAGSADPATRWQATQSLLTTIADQVPYVPLFQPDLIMALGGGLRFDAGTTVSDILINGTWVFRLNG